MKVLFLAGDELWFRRLPAAMACRDAGGEVVVMAPFQKYREVAEAEGFKAIPWSISRRSLNPLREIRTFIQVLDAYRQERPDLVHHLALKGIIYGAAAARICGGIPTVNSVAGLGRVFTVSTPGMRVLRSAVCWVLRAVFGGGNCRVTFENEDDLNALVEQRIVTREITKFIPGVGLDTERFSPVPEATGVPIVMLPSRMIWEKGISVFVEAAAQLKKEGVQARFVLVGAPDLENRGYIPEQQLKEWVESGNVEWWGSNRDMPVTLGQAHVVCLPTYYREGLPRVLMEASACARAIVTTDMPGCRHVVRDGENGLLVPPKDAPALAAAMKRLVEDPDLRHRMGTAGRVRATQEFSEKTVQRQIFEVYRSLLGGRWPPTQSDEDKQISKSSEATVNAGVRCQESPQHG
jgi:glycosyltransferase involved in cell wall biosynthesis